MSSPSPRTSSKLAKNLLAPALLFQLQEAAVEHADSALRYLEASRVEGLSGDLDHVELRGPDDETLGSLDGVLIDPVQRRLRFFVVEPAGRGRPCQRLLPTDCQARVDEDGRALRIPLDAEALARCPEFTRSSVPSYSDQDLIESIFRPRSA
jgi:hypothetical protein